MPSSKLQKRLSQGELLIEEKRHRVQLTSSFINCKILIEHGAMQRHASNDEFSPIICDLTLTLNREVQNAEWWPTKCLELEEQLQTKAMMARPC